MSTFQLSQLLHFISVDSLPVYKSAHCTGTVDVVYTTVPHGGRGGQSIQWTGWTVRLGQSPGVFAITRHPPQIRTHIDCVFNNDTFYAGLKPADIWAGNIDEVLCIEHSNASRAPRDKSVGTFGFSSEPPDVMQAYNGTR